MTQKNFKEGLPPREQLGEFGELLNRWENLAEIWEKSGDTLIAEGYLEGGEKHHLIAGVYRKIGEELEKSLWRNMEAKKAERELVNRRELANWHLMGN